eukprot:jgi/Galph1/4950/GphlegSOOS_G3666.1
MVSVTTKAQSSWSILQSALQKRRVPSTSQRYGLVHISCGDLLKAHQRQQTAVGMAVSTYMERGQLVPDEFVIPFILQRLSMQDCRENGFILDGFPRTISQAEALIREGFDPYYVFVLQADSNVLKNRLSGGRLDPETDRIYHKQYFRPNSTEVYDRLVPVSTDLYEMEFQLYCSNIQSILALFEPYVVYFNAEQPVLQVLRDISNKIEAAGINKLASFDWSAIDVQDVLESKVLASDSTLTPTERQGSNHKNGTADDTSNTLRLDVNNENKSMKAAKAQVSLIRCDGIFCEREMVEQSNIVFRGPATEQVMLVWNERPKTCLVLAKKDPSLFSAILKAVRYLTEKQKLAVVVESFLQPEILANGIYVESINTMSPLHEKVDFVVCLGGDGIIMHASTLFKTAMPPVICFNLGSFGFLTPFDFDSFEAEIAAMIEGRESLLSLRMRLLCTLLRKGYPNKQFQILNEVVVDRGASPYLCNLDCFCDNKYITAVQADGIIMSTPTGSTAYSMSAGGSMMHPSVPAILFTPICPHSLSFRPIIFPDSVQLRVDISKDARSHSWASFDGKFRQQLKRGEGLLVQMSPYPFPTINKTDHTGDWFASLDRSFHFNSRAIQKPFRNHTSH